MARNLSLRIAGIASIFDAVEQGKVPCHDVGTVRWIKAPVLETHSANESSEPAPTHKLVISPHGDGNQ